MSFSVIPQHMCRSIYSLDPEKLRAMGVRLLLADLDNTLARYDEFRPSPKLRTWEAQLRADGITLFVLSNSRKKTRTDVFCDGFIPFQKHSGKPKAEGFERAMRANGASAGETAMVGDQIFTDILGGNRAGVRTILVRPIALDGPFHAVRYAAETPFRLLCKDREEWK